MVMQMPTSEVSFSRAVISVVTGSRGSSGDLNIRSWTSISCERCDSSTCTFGGSTTCACFFESVALLEVDGCVELVGKLHAHEKIGAFAL